MDSLKSFVVLAEELHFGRAAELLNLSQPALTKQMHRLEEALGVRLLERGRVNQLTTAGALFAARARGVVAGYDELMAFGHQLSRGEAGRLRIGFGYHSLELVPRVVVALRDEVPAVAISLRDMATVEQLAELRAQTLDVGFVRLPVPPGLSASPVLEDELVLVTSKPARKLADLPLVLMARERTPTLFHNIVQLCARKGFTARVVQEAPEAMTVLALVRAGMGAAILPHSIIAAGFPGLHVLPLGERWEVACAWRSGDGNPVLGRFLRLLG